MSKERSQNGEWIPVSERIPEENGYYIATVIGLNNEREIDYCYLLDGEWRMATDGSFDKFDDGDVIAWMFLPAPYREPDKS